MIQIQLATGVNCGAENSHYPSSIPRVSYSSSQLPEGNTVQKGGVLNGVAMGSGSGNGSTSLECI